MSMVGAMPTEKIPAYRAVLRGVGRRVLQNRSGPARCTPDTLHNRSASAALYLAAIHRMEIATVRRGSPRRIVVVARVTVHRTVSSHEGTASTLRACRACKKSGMPKTRTTDVLAGQRLCTSILRAPDR